MRRWSVGTVCLSAVALAATLTGCAQREEPVAAPGVEERTFTLGPASTQLQVAFLKAGLEDLRVTARVEAGTEKVVDPPVLRARLKLKNASEDQTAHILSGRIDYMDVHAKPIPLPEGREAALRFWGADRLDPGMEAAQSIEVPFPAGALEEGELRDLRLELTYIPSPFRADRVTVPVRLDR